MTTQKSPTVKAYIVPLKPKCAQFLTAATARRFRPENWEDVQEGRERIELDLDGRNVCAYLTKPDSECWFVVRLFHTIYAKGGFSLSVAGDCYASRGEALAAADHGTNKERAIAIVGTLPTHAVYVA